MTDVKTNGSGHTELADQEATAQAAHVVIDNLAKISTAMQQQFVASFGAAAIIACLPGTADLDPQEVGAVIAALTRGRPDETEMRDKVALLAARVIALAREARDAKAAADARKVAAAAAN